MKKPNILASIAMAALMGGAALFTACNDKEEPTGASTGTLTGTVTESSGAAIDGVTITVKKGAETAATGTTGADGKYTITNIPMDANYTVAPSKTGYSGTSTTLTASKFDATTKTATLNFTMENANYKIMGLVKDGENSGAAFAGVTVTTSPATSTVTTGADGAYAIEGVSAADYVITFTVAEYPVATANISASDFSAANQTAIVPDVTLSKTQLLRGKTAADLATAHKLYYNEYRGGRNAHQYPHWDWSTDYMVATLDLEGDWEEQNEGTTLRIDNNAPDAVDTVTFNTYAYGSKFINDGSKILSLQVRTHGNSADAALTHFGVQVIDLSAAVPAAVKIGGVRTVKSEDFIYVEPFDLSAFVGKEVIVAIGTYRAKTNAEAEGTADHNGSQYWKQLVLRTIRFSDVPQTDGFNWMTGTEVETDWKLTKEMCASTMVNTNKSFTGISPTGGNRDNYLDGYRSWRTLEPAQQHVAMGWSFYPVQKDPEVFPSEGFIMKTKGGDAIVSTTVPQSLFYAKFAIAAGNNKLILKARNGFGRTEPTFFKLSAVENNGTLTHILPTAPVGGTLAVSEEGGDGTWKFYNDAGGADAPEGYATFTYDLSQFDGSDVTVVLGVYKGEANDGENKLCIYSITLE
jgi:hypothetical protein